MPTHKVQWLLGRPVKPEDDTGSGHWVWLPAASVDKRGHGEAHSIRSERHFKARGNFERAAEANARGFSLNPCSNSANSLFPATRFAAFVTRFPCAVRQGIGPHHAERPAEIAARRGHGPRKFEK
jgi:hypothetical protein